MGLLYSLDTLHLTMPISFLPRNTGFLGRAINWIQEVYHLSKFWLLVPLYIDTEFRPFDKLYVPDQLKTSISSMLSSATAFVVYCNNEINSDQSFLLFSKTMFVAALAHCMMGNVQGGVLEIFVEAIRLSGYSQDCGLLWKSVNDPKMAENALVLLVTF